MSRPEPGQIILVDGGDHFAVARVTRGRRNETRVETAGGRRILATDESWVALGLSTDSLAGATSWVNKLRARLEPDELAVLADAMAGQQTTVGALAETLLSDASAESRAAILIAVTDENDRLTVEGHAVRLRSPSERHARKLQAAAAKSSRADLAELIETRKQIITFGLFSGTVSSSLVDRLTAIAMGGKAPSTAWEKQLSGRLSQPIATAAARALADIGAWDGHEDVALLKSGLLAPWPETALAAIAAQPAGDLPTSELAFRAIDSVDPDEVDDAIWAERQGDDIRLVVAFASPSLWIGPGSAAELEARRRGATLYHPRHTSPMLPRGLLDQASLAVGVARPALICDMRIDPNGNRTLARLYEAKIELAEALVYDDVQRTLDIALDNTADSNPAPPWLAALHEATVRSERARIAAGAFLLYRPDIEVRAAPHQPATLRRAPQSIMARRLVGESMVQACTMVGAALKTAGIPAPFRSQKIRPDPPLQPGMYTEPADVQSMLGHLGPARTGSRPGRHDILGVDTYVQVSSPLRRYPDLLAHFQLIAWIRGQTAPFDRGQIDAAVKGQRTAVRTRRNAGQKGQRYFQLLALAREGLGTTLRAQVIRAGGPTARSVAFDPQRVLQIDLPGYLGPVGTWLDLEVVSVDAGEGRIEVRAADA
ncbi:MAG: RNB domain-containing ribonuclease [Myxococcales bacterium]|nr:RNB domain-containing ribonuclease [Myxococcales bacterium]